MLKTIKWIKAELKRVEKGTSSSSPDAAVYCKGKYSSLSSVLTMLEKEAPATAALGHTPNGYDPAWLAAINQVLEDRESKFRLVDITDELWDHFIGPMIDAIEGNMEHTIYSFPMRNAED